MPGFKETYLRYLSEVESMSFEFIGFVAEALGLGPDGLEHFYDVRGRMQHRSKVRVFGFLCAVCVQHGKAGEGEETRTPVALSPTGGPPHWHSVLSLTQ